MGLSIEITRIVTMYNLKFYYKKDVTVEHAFIINTITHKRTLSKHTEEFV